MIVERGDVMVVRFKRKVVKKRGSRTYGYGSSKKHRGKGSKGGKGLSGSGKKGQHKKLLLASQGYIIGKYGFKTPYQKRKLESVTTKEIIERFEEIVNKYGRYDKSKNTVIFNDNVKIIYQRSLEKNEFGNNVSFIVRSITDKAKEYLNKLGVKVEVKE